jgi:hypothetical protein
MIPLQIQEIQSVNFVVLLNVKAVIAGLCHDCFRKEDCHTSDSPSGVPRSSRQNSCKGVYINMPA